MNEIEKRMEVLRKRLNDLNDDIDSYSGEKVLEVSQELDKVILEYIKSYGSINSAIQKNKTAVNMTI